MNTTKATKSKNVLFQENSIGILGGTFDPIHIGHTTPAECVARWLNLDKILLIPAHIPPHKKTPKINAEQRAKMVDLVCEDNSLFQCDLRELHHLTPSYTVETLKELKQDYPNKTLFFIMGMDSLLTFTQWHCYKEILTLCHLVINTRPNYSLTQLNDETKLLLKDHKVTELFRLQNASFGHIIFTPNFSSESYINISSSNRIIPIAKCQFWSYYFYT